MDSLRADKFLLSNRASISFKIGQLIKDSNIFYVQKSSKEQFNFRTQIFQVVGVICIIIGVLPSSNRQEAKH